MTITQEDFKARLMSADPDKLSPIQKRLRDQEEERARVQAEIRAEFPPVFTLRSVGGVLPYPELVPVFRISTREGAIALPRDPTSFIGLDVQPNPVTRHWELLGDGVQTVHKLRGGRLTLLGDQWITLARLREEFIPVPVIRLGPASFAGEVAAVVDDMALYMEECAGAPIQLSARLTEEYYRLKIMVDNAAARFEGRGGHARAQLRKGIQGEDERAVLAWDSITISGGGEL